MANYANSLNPKRAMLEMGTARGRAYGFKRLITRPGKGDRIVLFVVDECEKCGTLSQAPNPITIPYTLPVWNRYVENGSFVHLPDADELGHHEEFGGAVCDRCYGVLEHENEDAFGLSFDLPEYGLGLDGKKYPTDSNEYAFEIRADDGEGMERIAEYQHLTDLVSEFEDRVRESSDRHFAFEIRPIEPTTKTFPTDNVYEDGPNPLLVRFVDYHVNDGDTAYTRREYLSESGMAFLGWYVGAVESGNILTGVAADALEALFQRL